MEQSVGPQCVARKYRATQVAATTGAIVALATRIDSLARHHVFVSGRPMSSVAWPRHLLSTSPSSTTTQLMEAKSANKGAQLSASTAIGFAASASSIVFGTARQKFRRCMATPLRCKSDEVAESSGDDSPKASVENSEQGEAQKAPAPSEAAAESKEVKKPVKWKCFSCGATNAIGDKCCFKCDCCRPTALEAKLLEERITTKEKIADILDKFIRLQAELQNYRRKHEESMADATGLGKKDAFRKLVPFTADIEKALVAPSGLAEKEAALFESYSILFKKSFGVWDKFGVKHQTAEVGTRFDPLNHLKVEERKPTSDDQRPGTILEVKKLGWACNGEMIVPSEVAIVAFPQEKKEVQEKEVKAVEEEKEKKEEEVNA